MRTDSPSEGDRSVITSLVRALRVLEAVAEMDSVSVGQLAAKTGYPKSTVHRILGTLCSQGYVQQEPMSGGYSTTVRLFELGAKAVARMDVVSASRPFLERLAAETSETVHLAVLDGGSVVYLDKIDSPHLLRMYSHVGRRAPAYCTGLGKALLSWLTEGQLHRLYHGKRLRRFTPGTITQLAALETELAAIRQRGFAVDNEEHEPGVVCFAAPVRERTGRVLAAISISIPKLRLAAADRHRCAQLVLLAARSAGERLGWAPPSGTTGPA